MQSSYNPTKQQVRSENNSGISDIDANGGEGNVFNDDTEESLNSPHVVRGGRRRARPSYDDNEPAYEEPIRRRRRPRGRIYNSYNPTIQQVNSINNKGVEHITANGGTGNVFNSHKHQDVNSPHVEIEPQQDPAPIPYVPSTPQITPSPDIDSLSDGSSDDGQFDAIPHSFYSYHEGTPRRSNPTVQHVVGSTNSGILDVDARGGDGNDFDDDNEESLNSPHVVNAPNNSPRQGWPSRRAGSPSSNSNSPLVQDVVSTGNSGISHISASGGSNNRFRTHKHQDLNSPHYERPAPIIPLPPGGDDGSSTSPVDSPPTIDTVNP